MAPTIDLSAIRTDATNYKAAFRTLISVYSDAEVNAAIAAATVTSGQIISALGYTPANAVHSHVIGDVTGLSSALSGLQPLDSDLTAIAALTTQSFGRSLLTQASAGDARSTLGAQADIGYTPANDANVVKLTGAQTVAGIKTFTSRIISGANTPSADDAGYLIARAVTGAGPHAVRDESTFDASANNSGYGAFDAATTIGGSSTYNHMAAFQARQIYNGSGTVADMRGFTSTPVHNGTGVVANSKQFLVGDVAGVGPVENNYGLFFNALVRGSVSNYTIYSLAQNAPAYFSDQLQIGKDANTNGSGTSDGHIQVRAYTGSIGKMLAIGYNSTGNYGWLQASYFNAAAYAPLVLQANGGNVLLGTTTDNGSKLQVAGAATFSGAVSVGQYAANEILAGPAGLHINANSGLGTWPIKVSYDGSELFKVHYTGAATFSGAIGGTSAKFSGDVGIGVPSWLSPSSPLHQYSTSVNGSGITLQNTTASQLGDTLIFQGGSTGFSVPQWANATVIEGRGGNGVTIGAFYGDFKVLTGASRTTRLTIDSTGAATFSGGIYSTVGGYGTAYSTNSGHYIRADGYCSFLEIACGSVGASANIAAPVFNLSTSGNGLYAFAYGAGDIYFDVTKNFTIRNRAGTVAYLQIAETTGNTILKGNLAVGNATIYSGLIANLLGGNLCVTGTVSGAVDGDPCTNIYLSNGLFDSSGYFNSTPGIGSVYGSVQGIAGDLAAYVYNGLSNSRLLGLRLRHVAGSRVDTECRGSLMWRPAASATPTANTDLVVEATSNTTLTFKLKGTDGTVRSGTITLA